VKPDWKKSNIDSILLHFKFVNLAGGLDVAALKATAWEGKTW